MSSVITYSTDYSGPECTFYTSKGEPFAAERISYSALAYRDTYREGVTVTGTTDFGRGASCHLDGFTHADLPEPPQWFVDAARCLQMDAEAGR